MANTFNLGNGNWASKKEAVLAYNSENNNFKPLPFTFDRASTATVVNKQGLIETVGVDEPRIDFLNDSKGHLLLEPSRQNVALYSEDFSNGVYSKTNGTVTTNTTISPDGTQNADTWTATSGSANLQGVVSITSGVQYTMSIYLKRKTGTGQVSLRGVSNTSTNVTITDEWQRYSVTLTSTDTNGRYGVLLLNSGDEVYVWGAQLEQGYLTSYIPTQGSAVTRSNEDINLTLPDNASFNSSVGFTLYGEFLTNGGNGASPMALQFNGNTGYFGFGHNSAAWRARINNGTDNELYTSSASIFSVGKLALSFSSSGFSMYANGASFASGNTDISAITSSDSVIYRNNTEEFGSFQIRELKLYNTRLSDNELQALTS